MTLDDVFCILRERGAVLFVRDGQLRYLGPVPMAADDPLRAGIAEHREILIEMFTFVPGGRCVFSRCYRLLADGDPIACPDHRARLEETPMPWIDDTEETASLAEELAGCCTPGRPCFDHFDQVFEAHRNALEDALQERGSAAEAA